jgi:repressor of nif and glnA expression
MTIMAQRAFWSWYPGRIMSSFRVVYEEFKVHGKELVDKVSKLIQEGNVRRIIVKDEKGNTFLEIPLTVATVGAVAAPVLAGLGAIAALIANFTIGVESVRHGVDDVVDPDPDPKL